MIEKLRDHLIRDEGLRLKVYKDSVGIETIGVGRNLVDKGISRDEAMHMLDNDIADVQRDAQRFRWFAELNEPRQAVVLNMIFNLGVARFSEFRQTIAAIEARAYLLASERMLDSKWAKQVGARADRLAEMMRTGRWLEDKT